MCYYIRTDLNVEVVSSYPYDSMCEVLMLTLTLPSKCKFLFVGGYRTPSSGVSYWENLEHCIEHALNVSRLSSSSMLIMGDLNVNTLKPDSPQLSHIKDICATYNLSNIVNEPTRFPSNSSLDVVLVPENPADGVRFTKPCVLSLDGLSDHDLILFSLCTKHPVSVKKHELVLTRKSWRCVKLDSAREDILKNLHQAQQTVCDEMSVDALFNVWTDAVKLTLDMHTKPTVRRVPKTNKPKPQPWVTPPLKALLQKRIHAHREARKNPQNARKLWKYRNLRREGTLLNRRLKQKYYLDLMRSNAFNPRQHWKVIREVTGRPKVHARPVAPIDELSDFFRGTVSCPTRQQLVCPEGPQPEESLTVFSEVSVASVERALEHLSSVKACGSDEIPSSMLRSLSDDLAPSLTDLFNESLTSSTVPSTYKIASVTPILKKGNPREPTNYRPISLLPIASKLLERCVFDQCKSYFRKKPELGLPTEQFAYRRYHSCEDLLSTVINDFNK